MERYNAVRGTADLWGEKLARFRFIEETARKIFPLYNYKEIITPLFEETALFSRTIGEETDIVGKEMYSFLDRGGRSITLRPEGTAPVVRAVVEHYLYRQTRPLKLFYFGPMFRYERPQAGRQRQFHQLGFEAIGSAEASIDAEIICLAWHFFRKLGLKSIIFKLNNLGCHNCQAAFRKKLEEYLSDKVDRLCPDCQRRRQRNIFRLLDCKKESCQEILHASPQSLESLCRSCQAHEEELEGYLRLSSIPYELDKSLVRGLDYYTGTVFEVSHQALGAQDAIAGGGRYDTLIEELGGPALPAIGFACGVERLMAAMEGEGVSPLLEVKPDLYIITLGAKEKQKGFELIAFLRKEGLSCEMGHGEKSLKAEMRQADKAGAKFIAILGENEIREGTVTIKSLKDGTQEGVAWPNVFACLKERLKKL